MMMYQDATKSPRERANDLLSRMTLQEKVGQINQRLLGFSVYERHGDDISLTDELKEEVGKHGGLGVLYGLYRADPWSQRDFESGLYGTYMKKAYNLVQRYVIEHSRFSIPMLLSTECPHGHQALDGYLLPVNLAMGATWNPELIRKAYRVCGKQMKELGTDFALISMLDVLRDPRWGRSEECYSEDPYLAASMAKEAVTGCQEVGVPVVSKHFCAQGETTGGINASAARIGGRELREIHLLTMKACCEAKVAGVMAAYNEIDGIFCHGNKELLQDILRGELGFTGMVMADGVAIDRLDVLTGDSAASGAMALKAGVDISLWDEAFSHLEEAVGRGLITEQEVNQAALRVLEMKFERGLFEHPYLNESEPEEFSYKKYSESLDLARESAVLLKQTILPLNKMGLRVAVIGPNADNLYNQLGDYTPAQRVGQGITLLRGLQEEFGKENVLYAQGCQVCGDDRTGIDNAIETAKKCDVVILALGGSSSRFAGVTFDNNGAAVPNDLVQMDCGEGVDTVSLRLPGVQEELAEAVFHTGKQVISVIIAGRPYVLPEIIEKSGDVVYAFYPGPMGGKALAELLRGKYSPSGRLPASLPRSVGQLPCYYNPKNSYPKPYYPNEETGALYPFGWGLSYTQFEITNVRFPSPILQSALINKERGLINFTVKNLGKMDAYAVLQLFIHDEQASTTRRVKELKSFEKVFVRAGEEKECVLTLGVEELSLWNNEMKFVLEPGEFRLFLEEGGTQYAEGILTVI